MPRPENTDPVVFEYRSLLNRDFTCDDLRFPYVSLSSANFATVHAHLPDTARLTESNLIISKLASHYQIEQNHMRNMYEKQIQDRDALYVRALTEIKETLRSHSVAIDELRQR